VEVLVTGGTGVVGRQVVERLHARGTAVRVLSRRSSLQLPDGVRTFRGDLRSGAGLSEALAGADVVVHCASATGNPLYRPARRTDVDGTRRLLEAARQRGTPHLVYISIVGVDRVPLGYYRAKLETEQVIENSHLPYTILRTTQFHDLVLRVLQTSPAPLLIIPAGFRFQPIHSAEVAERLVELTRSSPAGHVADMGGPQVRGIEDLARTYLVSTGRTRVIVRLPLPGRAAAAFRAGHHLCPERVVGTVSWEDFLTQHLDSSSRNETTRRPRHE